MAEGRRNSAARSSEEGRSIRNAAELSRISGRRLNIIIFGENSGTK